MPRASKSAGATRRYQSPLREEQAEQTRRRIVEAIVEQLSDTGRTDFSTAQIARRAGVATRTVYRHFPTRDDLLAAVDEEIRDRVPASEDSAEGFLDNIGVLLDWFEANPELVEASHVTNLGREVRAYGRRKRSAHVKKVLDEVYADLPARSRKQAFGAIRSMLGSHAWRTMRQELGMSQRETVDTMTWIARLILDDMERQRREKRGKRR